MATDRATSAVSVTVDGVPQTMTYIQNPTIDDLLQGEAQVQAFSIESNDPTIVTGRVVPRVIRDYLIRLGVER